MTRTFLHLDCETRSPIDLKKCGLEKYAQQVEMLMLAWAIDNGPVNLWIPSEGEMPMELFEALASPEVIKVAWNAQFERTIIKATLCVDIPHEYWMDPAAMSRFGSCPTHLKDACKVFKLASDKAKDKRGSRLIQIFCNPTKRGHKTKETAPKEWQEFCDYCRQDVIAEREIFHIILPLFELPEREQRIFKLDQKINELGMPVDRQFVRGALAFVADVKRDMFARMKELTGLDNPNSNVQLMRWLKQQGYPYKSLGKPFVQKAIASGTSFLVAEVLNLRLQYNKASLKKLDALELRMLEDGWIRRNYKYYAAHTGRWAGEGVQLQNLPRPIKALEDKEAYVAAIEYLRNYEARPSA